MSDDHHIIFIILKRKGRRSRNERLVSCNLQCASHQVSELPKINSYLKVYTNSESIRSRGSQNLDHA